jgi:glycosyltransferase involved in cell wall biosynthesis
MKCDNILNNTTKKILIFNIGPVFKDHVHGGSQKILRDIAIYLGERGHSVTILCVSRKDNKIPFNLSKKVIVKPILKFKETFPSSYKTSPHNLLNIIKIISSEIKKHDVFYSHGSGLNFPFLYNMQIPTIISLRDFVYPETLVGAFNFKRDKLIVNSTSVKEVVLNSMGKFIKNLSDRLILIENGIDFSFFKRKEPSNIFKYLEKGINKNDKVVLYPHRPETSKGIFDTMELVKRLKFDHKIKDIKLLIPKYFDEEMDSGLESHYLNLLKIAEEKGIAENIIFHKWIPYELMPEYYSLGDLTLVIGNFIEAFGSNTTIESLGCGTPVIISKVGALRTTLPDNLIPKIDYGDIIQLEKNAVKLLQNKDLNFDNQKIKDYLINHFSYKRMLESYEDILCNTKIMNELDIKIIDEKPESIKIAPWCYLTTRGIYSDYDYKTIEISPELYTLLKNSKKNSIEEIIEPKLKSEIDELIKEGIFI